MRLCSHKVSISEELTMTLRIVYRLQGHPTGINTCERQDLFAGNVENDANQGDPWEGCHMVYVWIRAEEVEGRRSKFERALGTFYSPIKSQPHPLLQEAFHDFPRLTWVPSSLRSTDLCFSQWCSDHTHCLHLSLVCVHLSIRRQRTGTWLISDSVANLSVFIF
jgi:hypothetical protein